MQGYLQRAKLISSRRITVILIIFVFLQVVCRFVFLSSVENFGLLRNAPVSIKTELYDTLQQCAYGEEVVDGVHWRKPHSDVINKIEFLVYSTIKK